MWKALKPRTKSQKKILERPLITHFPPWLARALAARPSLEPARGDSGLRYPKTLGLRLRFDPPRLKQGRPSPNRLRVVSRAAASNASPCGVFCPRTAAGFANQMYAATPRFRDTIEGERFSDPRMQSARRPAARSFPTRRYKLPNHNCDGPNDDSLSCHYGHGFALLSWQGSSGQPNG